MDLKRWQRRLGPVMVALCLMTPPARSQAQDSPPKNDSPPTKTDPAPKTDPAAEMRAWEELQKPGPEHETLKKFVGQWTAEVTTTMPDGTPMKSTGKESATLVLGGRFVETRYEGEMMGKPFSGMSLMGYDKMLKKYVTTWADSMSTGVMVFYGDSDKDGKVFTQYAEQKTADGKVEKWKTVTTLVDDTTMTFEMVLTLPDGKDMKVMSTTYTKVK